LLAGGFVAKPTRDKIQIAQPANKGAFAAKPQTPPFNYAHPLANLTIPCYNKETEMLIAQN
jgi:hypothetical protein